MAALLLTIFFLIDFILGIMAFIAAITKVATVLGATPSGGLIALVVILLIVTIVFFVLQMFCAVVSLKPSLDVFAGKSTP